MMIALVLAGAATTAACDDQPTEPREEAAAGWEVPQDGFCDEIVAEAGITAKVEETLSGDDEDLTAVCVIRTEDSRVDLGVRVTEKASDQYEQTFGEREDGFIGFAEPVVSAPEGWWSRGTRYEAVEYDSVRLADLLLDENLVVRLQLVQTPTPGDATQRQAQARDTADALDAAVGAALEG
ncbi:hypothetical protein [Nocardioides sp. cx-173]|uniref:hypothetical protein n=1 Tax=Nocardioides sp. cx-173 TaxID=2898796 RepID=UPI001E367E59|nr:hypothetical protein [Nocardioides sp. cx-173]MCD4526699.1 hypothetical protein [Nocardioides sp. cx-173]UGB42559.1 hypothetical protein LQ940_03300 [Nocardioides sp. cx-173]